ncbi:trimethylamine monooxygenase-like isoform X1 [Ruditapes philippinarum]|uniref:trimethylamine monooxygenase-like isoform X1 n=1 Tax=Ruditapes philippinarum TaxID=129788 RepID=UPI00295B09F4|nr:trimethylamine monooxygenase-like isoform X1 [Ruditapes philippinarum]
MSKQKPRVCIIGAGPSGMSVMYQIKQLYPDVIDFECYEKQETWCGQWNYTWRTDSDEYGERIHNCMYRNLWTIGAKESMEFKDYTFQDHFGKELPSYLPRELHRRYLDGRMKRISTGDFFEHIHFQHEVRSVEYRDSTDDFLVWARNFRSNSLVEEVFSHVIVSTGCFSYPNMPTYPGIDTFHGRILHSHEFREAKEFTNQNVLIIGGRFSASEIALQLNKYGSKHVICSCKEPINFKWPKGVEERPIVDEIKGNTAVFKDKTQFDFDAIIYCTGYRYNYPFLKGGLHFDVGGTTTLLPDNLYKGTVWLKGGNKKLFHMAAFDVFLGFGIIDAQATWILKFISKELSGQSVQWEEMEAYVKEWQKKQTNVKSVPDMFKFQRDFYHDIGKDIDLPPEYIDKAYDILIDISEQKQINAMGHKDVCYKSMYTGKLAPSHHTSWTECMDDSVDAYI